MITTCHTAIPRIYRSGWQDGSFIPQLLQENKKNRFIDMRYMLEKYHTPSSRHTCPKCGRKRCFTYYIDTETGKPLDPSCGKCDHLNSCGYHLPPREFLKGDHAAERRSTGHTEEERRREGPVRLTMHLPGNMPQLCMGEETLLHSWLLKWFPVETVRRVCRLYWLGQWHDHRVVFWQIDGKGTVHDGKIMDYLPNGHRNPERPPSWVSAELRRQGKVPAEAVTRKGLFGGHLILDAEHQGTGHGEGTGHDKRTVCLVESEKSAVWLACRFPRFVWVATGGCKALKAEVLRPLVGRRLVVFPDSGMHEEWGRVLRSVEGLEFLLHNFDYLPKNTDIVDVLCEKDMMQRESSPTAGA